MISRMQQQELEIQGVIGTIYANIDQLCRSELVVCLPKLHKSLSSLLGKHFHSTKHLGRKLGEDHPMATMWRQRVDEVHEEANEAIRCLCIVLRNYNDDWWWATDEIEDNTSAQAVAASELRVAEDVLPAALQVQVTVKGNDAAANLPIGGVATVINTADADTATRSQDAQSEGWEAPAEAPADTMPPAVIQVQLCPDELKDAAANLPVGGMATGDHPSQAEAAQEVARLSPNKSASASVQIFSGTAKPALAIQMLHSAQTKTARTTQPETKASSVEARDASPYLPVDSVTTGVQPSHAEEYYKPQCAPEADVCSKEAAHPSQILNRCLAQASTAAEKLDRLSAPQAGCGKHGLARVHPIDQVHLDPREQLDVVLARASALLGKLDNLATRVAGPRDPNLQVVAATDISAEHVGDRMTGPRDPDQMVAATNISAELVGDRMTGQRDPDQVVLATDIPAELVGDRMIGPIDPDQVVAATEISAELVVDRVAGPRDPDQVRGQITPHLMTEPNPEVVAATDISAQLVGDSDSQSDRESSRPQVQVSICDAKYTAPNLPLGEVATEDPADANTATQPQPEPAAAAKHLVAERTSPQDDAPLKADSMSSIRLQVQVSICDAKDTAKYLPLGEVDTGDAADLSTATQPQHERAVAAKHLVAESTSQQEDYIKLLKVHRDRGSSDAVHEALDTVIWQHYQALILILKDKAVPSSILQEHVLLPPSLQDKSVPSSILQEHVLLPPSLQDKSLPSSILQEYVLLPPSLQDKSVPSSILQEYVLMPPSLRDKSVPSSILQEHVLLPPSLQDKSALPSIQQEHGEVGHSGKNSTSRGSLNITTKPACSKDRGVLNLHVCLGKPSEPPQILQTTERNQSLQQVCIKEARGKRVGLRTGHQRRTSNFQRSNVPIKRNKVQKPKLYLASLTMDELPFYISGRVHPLCSSSRQPPQREGEVELDYQEDNPQPRRNGIINLCEPDKYSQSKSNNSGLVPIKVQVSETGINDTADILPIGHGRLKEKHTVGVTQSPRHQYICQSHVEWRVVLPESIVLDEAVSTIPISAWQLMQTSGPAAADIMKQTLAAGSQEQEPLIIQGWYDSVGSTVKSSAGRVSSASISPLGVNSGNSPSIAVTTALPRTEVKEDTKEITAITSTAEKAQLTFQSSLAAPMLRITVRATSSQPADSVHSQSSTQEDGTIRKRRHVCLKDNPQPERCGDPPQQPTAENIAKLEEYTVKMDENHTPAGEDTAFVLQLVAANIRKQKYTAVFLEVLTDMDICMRAGLRNAQRPNTDYFPQQSLIFIFTTNSCIGVQKDAKFRGQKENPVESKDKLEIPPRARKLSSPVQTKVEEDTVLPAHTTECPGRTRSWLGGTKDRVECVEKQEVFAHRVLDGHHDEAEHDDPIGEEPSVFVHVEPVGCNPSLSQPVNLIEAVTAVNKPEVVMEVCKQGQVKLHTVQLDALGEELHLGAAHNRPSHGQSGVGILKQVVTYKGEVNMAPENEGLPVMAGFNILTDHQQQPCKGKMNVVTSTAEQADDPSGSEAEEPDMGPATRIINPNLEVNNLLTTVPALSVCSVRRPWSAVGLEDGIRAQEKGVHAQSLEVEKLENMPANPIVAHGIHDEVQVDVVHNGHGGIGWNVGHGSRHVSPKQPGQEAIKADSEPEVHDVGIEAVGDAWVQAEVRHEGLPLHPLEQHCRGQQQPTVAVVSAAHSSSKPAETLKSFSNRIGHSITVYRLVEDSSTSKEVLANVSIDLIITLNPTPCTELFMLNTVLDQPESVGSHMFLVKTDKLEFDQYLEIKVSDEKDKAVDLAAEEEIVRGALNVHLERQDGSDSSGRMSDQEDNIYVGNEPIRVKDITIATRCLVKRALNKDHPLCQGHLGGHDVSGHHICVCGATGVWEDGLVGDFQQNVQGQHDLNEVSAQNKELNLLAHVLCKVSNHQGRGGLQDGPQLHDQAWAQEVQCYHHDQAEDRPQNDRYLSQVPLIFIVNALTSSCMMFAVFTSNTIASISHYPSLEIAEGLVKTAARPANSEVLVDHVNNLRHHRVLTPVEIDMVNVADVSGTTLTCNDDVAGSGLQNNSKDTMRMFSHRRQQASQSASTAWARVSYSSQKSTINSRPKYFPEIEVTTRDLAGIMGGRVMATWSDMADTDGNPRNEDAKGVLDQGGFHVGHGQVGQEPVQDYRIGVVHSTSEQSQTPAFREVISKTQNKQFYLSHAPRMREIHMRRVHKPTQKRQRIKPEGEEGQVRKDIIEERQISCLLSGVPPQQEVGGGQLGHKDRTTNLCCSKRECCASATEIKMVQIVVMLAWVLSRVWVTMEYRISINRIMGVLSCQHPKKKFAISDNKSGSVPTFSATYDETAVVEQGEDAQHPRSSPATRKLLVSKLKDPKHDLGGDMDDIEQNVQEGDWKIKEAELYLPEGGKGGHSFEDTREVLGSSEFSTAGQAQDPRMEAIDETGKVIKEFITIAALVSEDRVIKTDARQEEHLVEVMPSQELLHHKQAFHWSARDARAPGGGQMSLHHQERQHEVAQVRGIHDDGQVHLPRDILHVGQVFLFHQPRVQQPQSEKHLNTWTKSGLNDLGSIDQVELGGKPEMEIDEDKIEVIGKNLTVPALALVFHRGGPSVWCEGAPSAALSEPSKDQVELRQGDEKQVHSVVLHGHVLTLQLQCQQDEDLHLPLELHPGVVKAPQDAGQLLQYCAPHQVKFQPRDNDQVPGHGHQKNAKQYGAAHDGQQSQPLQQHGDGRGFLNQYCKLHVAHVGGGQAPHEHHPLHPEVLGSMAPPSNLLRYEGNKSGCLGFHIFHIYTEEIVSFKKRTIMIMGISMSCMSHCSPVPVMVDQDKAMLVREELPDFALDQQGGHLQIQSNQDSDLHLLLHGEVTASQGAGHHHQYWVPQPRHHRQSQDILPGSVHVLGLEQDVDQDDGVCHQLAEGPHVLQEGVDVIHGCFPHERRVMRLHRQSQQQVPLVTRGRVHEAWLQVYLQVQILTVYNYKGTACLTAGRVLAFANEHHSSKLEDRKLLGQEEGPRNAAMSADQTFPEGWIEVTDLPLDWLTQSETEIACHQPLLHSAVRAQISTRDSDIIHLGRGINVLAMEVLESSIQLDRQDTICERVKEEPFTELNVEMKWESFSGFNICQLIHCNKCPRAISSISLHCRKVTSHCMSLPEGLLASQISSSKRFRQVHAHLKLDIKLNNFPEAGSVGGHQGHGHRQREAHFP